MQLGHSTGSKPPQAEALHRGQRRQNVGGEKYRGNFERVIEQYTADRLKDYCGTDGTAIVVHPAAQAEAVAAACRVLEQDGRFEQIIVARAGCTVACHCGPNTVGVMFFKNPQ